MSVLLNATGSFDFFSSSVYMMYTNISFVHIGLMLKKQAITYLSASSMCIHICTYMYVNELCSYRYPVGFIKYVNDGIYVSLTCQVLATPAKSHCASVYPVHPVEYAW